MIELQIVCYVVAGALVAAGAPWWCAMGAWAVGFALVLRPRGRSRLKPATPMKSAAVVRR